MKYHFLIHAYGINILFSYIIDSNSDFNIRNVLFNTEPANHSALYRFNFAVMKTLSPLPSVSAKY